MKVFDKNCRSRYTLLFAFQSVFESPEAKAAILLCSLPESMNNIIDNLQTKEDLTYDQVYNKLMDLKILLLLTARITKRIKPLMLKEKERNYEENPPARDQRPYPRNAPTAKSTTQLLAVMAIPGMSV